MNPRGKDFEPKQEGDDVNNNDPNKYSNKATAASTSTTSRQWSSFRNPRIVRVSRTCGGKDRHSKVCTVKGLRDRRIRLSVPTAIQLYDLQDRLGLSQPSKVVDWLLDATKDDIDQLPPLPIPPGNFTPFHQAIALSHQQQQQQHFFGATNPTSFMKDMGIKMMNDPQNGNDQTYFLERSKYWSSSGRKELVEEREAPVGSSSGKDKWIASNDEEDNQAFQCQSLFPIGGNHASFPPSLLPYNPFNYHWEPSNLSLSQIGSGSHSINHIPMQQTEEDSNNNNSSHHQHNSSSSSPSIIHHHQQLHFCPSAAALLPTNLPSLPLPSFMAASSSVVNDDPRRQINQFQFLTSSSSHHHQNSLMPTLHLISSPTKSLTLNVFDPRMHHHDSRENNDSHPNKGGTAGS